jgi:hypothetical protein
MSDQVMALALLCLAGIAGLALWVSPDVGKEIAAVAVGAIGGALSTRAIGMPEKKEGP